MNEPYSIEKEVEQAIDRLLTALDNTPNCKLHCDGCMCCRKGEELGGAYANYKSVMKELIK